VLFDETLDSNWIIPPQITNWTITTDTATSGTHSLLLSLNQTAFFMGRNNPQQSYLASDYTHITFKIRAVSGRGMVNVGFGAGNMTDILDNRFFGGSINNPQYKTGYPIDDTAWQLIAVPLSAIGLGNTGILQNELWTFYFFPAYWDYVPTQIYLDELTLSNYVTSFTTQTMATNNINYQYVYSPAASPGSPGSPSSPSSPSSSPSPSSPAGTNNNNLNNNPSSQNAWGTPVTIVLCIVIAVLIGAIVYLKFFAKPSANAYGTGL